MKTALITGATSGIGKATAMLLSRNNYRLILTGRRKERLEELEKELSTSCRMFTGNFDIRNRKEVNMFWDNLPDSWKRIDILVNNAGLAAGLDPVNNADVEDWEDMIDTNVKGLLYMTQLVSRKMIERSTGHIVNISSIAGQESYPNGSVYCATKYAVNAISKALRIELLPHNIKVSTISPGAVDTEFSLVRFKQDKQRADQVYEGFVPLNADDVAEAIYFIITRPSHVNIDEMLIMPTAQGSARDFYRNKK